MMRVTALRNVEEWVMGQNFATSISLTFTQYVFKNNIVETNIP